MRLFSLAFAVLLSALQLSAQTTLPALLYKTGFEVNEGFDARFTLVGQVGWVGEGSGGNGLLGEAAGFEGLGQQAYVGFHPPTDTNASTSVWRPVNYDPFPENVDIVSFSVKMKIVNSENGRFDDFRWSIYNTNGVRLFSVEFENSPDRAINYIMEDNTLVSTGFSFDYDGTYDLQIYMNFRRNIWTALLNGVVLVSSELISTKAATGLHLGDVDAVWVLRNTARPGDNYMVFDNYTVIAEDSFTLPAAIGDVMKNAEGNIQFRAFGEADWTYAVDVTSDFESWFSLGEFVMPEIGFFDFEDTTSQEYDYGFYSLRLVEDL